MTRLDGYSPTQIESIPPDAVVTVCEVHADLAPSAPEGWDPSKADSAIVWLGLKQESVLDAVASEDKLAALMEKLPQG